MSESPQPGSGIVVTLRDGQVIAGKAPSPGTPSAPPASHGPVVEHNQAEKVVVTVSKEVEQQRIERKRTHTYTIEQLRQKRHDRELTSPSVFQFHAEIQLYKRYLAGTRRKRAVQQLDMPALQHRINSILLQLNITTFQQVFNDILSLGVESDVFVLSFVNVVYKQAVLNPSLALLFSMLSANVWFVMKHTKYSGALKDLFRERCEEAFLVPKADTDRGTLILLRGVVIFAGHLLRDKMLHIDLLTNWANKLLQSGTNSALELVIDLFLAAGVQIARDNKAVIDRISEKMKDNHDPELAEPYKHLMEMVTEPVAPVSQSERELNSPQMKRSPSLVDKELSGKYSSLFKKSSSIPVELSNLAGDDDEEESMNTLVNQFFYQAELQEFLDGLERLSYKKGDGKIAIDLLRAILKQPPGNVMVVWLLVLELWRNRFYDDDALRQAIKTISHECAGDEETGEKMTLVYAQLLTNDVLTFDDFPVLFGDLMGVWRVMVRKLFVQLDQLRGEWLEDILESDFWRNLEFLGVNGIAEKLQKLAEWDLLTFLPQYELASAFLESVEKGDMSFDITAHEDIGLDNQEIAPVIFEAITTLDDDKMKAVAEKLKGWFKSNSSLIPDVAAKCGPKGAALAALLQ